MTTGKKKKAQDQASQPRTAVLGLGVSRRDAFSFLALGVLIAVVYFPAALAGFVWDDSIMRELRAVSTWGGIWELWFDPVGAYLEGGTRKEGHYWPLLYTTFW